MIHEEEKRAIASDERGKMCLVDKKLDLILAICVFENLHAPRNS